MEVERRIWLYASQLCEDPLCRSLAPPDEVQFWISMGQLNQLPSQTFPNAGGSTESDDGRRVQDRNGGRSQSGERGLYDGVRGHDGRPFRPGGGQSGRGTFCSGRWQYGNRVEGVIDREARGESESFGVCRPDDGSKPSGPASDPPLATRDASARLKLRCRTAQPKCFESRVWLLSCDHGLCTYRYTDIHSSICGR